MPHPPRVLSAAILAALLLAFWAIRRPPAPEPRREASAASDASSASASTAQSPAPAPRNEAAAASAPPPTRLERLRECLHLAETDPLAAMDVAIAQKLTADDPGLLTNLLMQWASRDFDAACEWTKTQEAGAWRDNCLAHLGYLRAQTDPLAAARLVVADISPGPARDEAIISVVHQWALRDPEAAGLWAGALADEALRQRAATEVATLVAASSRPSDAP